MSNSKAHFSTWWRSKYVYKRKAAYKSISSITNRRVQLFTVNAQVNWPYLWSPFVVETQLFRIGQVILAGVPGELTTMAGRRLRNQINKVVGDSIPNLKTIIAGLSNGYSHYITTFKEYQVSTSL